MEAISASIGITHVLSVHLELGFFVFCFLVYGHGGFLQVVLFPPTYNEVDIVINDLNNVFYCNMCKRSRPTKLKSDGSVIPLLYDTLPILEHSQY